MSAPYPPPAATPANDRTTLWGVLGIVFAFCCPIVGVIFGILSLQEAKKAGKPPTLAYVALALNVLSIVCGAISGATGRLELPGTS